MITVRDITVRFGGVTALDGVSAEFHAPITGIIGPNGAGKTTLLNVLSGFVQPDMGEARLGDEDLLPMAPHIRARHGLRRSFQAEQIAEDLTVENNIRVMLDPLPLTAADRSRALEHAMEFTGLLPHRSVLGAALTNVDRRMTEIARAVAGNPRVVMLDEPGGGLGEAETERLRDAISAIPGTFGAQVLLIDHDVDLIRAVCGETLVLDFGRRLAFGETEATLNDPAVRAAYLSEAPDDMS